MPPKNLSALITCEVTDEFLENLKTRGIDFELAGWGVTGIVMSPEELLERARNCEILIVEIEELNSGVLSQLKSVKFIGVSRGTPVNVDLDFCKKNEIAVVSTPGRNADSVADYCLGVMLDLTRKISSSSRHLMHKGWLYDGKLPYLAFRGNQLGSLTIGLYGYGQIGERVAKRLKHGFGSNVIFYDPFVTSSEFAEQVSSLEELFTQSDVLSLHAPVVATTKNTVTRDLLQKLGRDGVLINSARADLVVEDDLFEALSHGEISGAALDVYWSEPIDKSSRWIGLTNVLCTPHIAGASLNVVTNHCAAVLKGLDQWLVNFRNQGGNL
jgi:phosphoglycerate dehydrogenase-like enzyme